MVARPTTDRPKTPVEKLAKGAEVFNQRARRLNRLVRNASALYEQTAENAEEMNKKIAAVADEAARQRARAKHRAMVRAATRRPGR